MKLSMKNIKLTAKPRFKAELATDGTLELLVYGDIVDAATISMLEAWGYSSDGFVSALSVKKAMDANPTYSRIRLRINSPGGDAFEGMAIHSLLSAQARPVEACVDGVAASAASIIAMAGGTRVMGRTAMMMIHNAWGGCIGNSRDMRKMGDTLDKIDESIGAAYASRTGKPLKDILSMMNEETWLSAQDCVDQGFATSIVELPEEDAKAAMAMAKRFQALNRMSRVPEALKAEAPDAQNGVACTCDCENCVAGDCENCNNADCTDRNCEDCPMQADKENSARGLYALNYPGAPIVAAPVPADTSMERARLKLRQRRNRAV